MKFACFSHRLGRPLTFMVLLLAFLSLARALPAAETVWLTQLDLSLMTQGYGTAQIDRSIREKPLSIGGKKYDHGVGTHANSEFTVDMAGGSDRFQAEVGVDDNAGGACVLVFQVFADGKPVFSSGEMKPGDAAKAIDLDLKGAKMLTLMVDTPGKRVTYCHGDWAEARFTVSGAKPKALGAPKEEPVILTPKPGPAPKINGPKVYGCRPGHPFVYRIPTTGKRPIAFSAEGLPASVKLDAEKGILTGSAPERGEYKVTLRAKNDLGESTRAFKIVSGDTLALTPPMGWNHWYAHYNNITDKLMREAADVMVKSGMADVGYQYVSIDDCWMNAPQHKDPLRVGPGRDAQGNILPNKHFPDMPGLTAYIHALGLKAGIYTSPGPLTCAKFEGAYQHEAADAKQFADWGFDFLKHDWCSYGRLPGIDNKVVAVCQKPYKMMGDILKKQDRDIVFNLCQYGMGNVWEWGEAVGGHCWRTSGDLGYELRRFYEVALKNAEHGAFSKPGAWNDPDYIQIGFTGGRNADGTPKPFPLSPNEQYAFMSLWCLMASPLFYSGDMGLLNDLTVSVLCNNEVIDVDQDPLGQSAEVKQLSGTSFIMVKQLEDGAKAVGLFNRTRVEQKLSASWAELGVTGKQAVRDLWRQKDLGEFEGKFETAIPPRGVVMVRVGK